MEFDNFTTEIQCEEITEPNFLERDLIEDEDEEFYCSDFFTSLGTRVSCSEMLEIAERVSMIQMNHQCYHYLDKNPIPDDLSDKHQEFLSKFNSLFRETMEGSKIDNKDILSDCFDEVCEDLTEK